MSYTLIIAEVRKDLFEERNLDSFGLSALLGKDAVLLVPEGPYEIPALADTVLKVKMEESSFLNPLTMASLIEKVIEAKGKPHALIFTHSSSGAECAAYVAGKLGLPLVTDVNGYDKDRSIFFKSYYSDKIFGEFTLSQEGPFIVTVRSGSFKEFALEKALATETMEGVPLTDGRSFLGYVEEEKTGIDITKAEFLLSVGRGIGSKDEIPDYEELASILKAVLSGSRPVIDKMWLPKPRQVGTSGKTVKPKVYLAMGISGAFQHIAGMKDSECIIAVNKDPEAPIFQYAHFGIVGDVHKVRDKIKDIVRG